jgi:hypothetical protein
MDKFKVIKQKTYTLKFFKNKELFKIIEKLPFDDAYKLAVPEEALAMYPGNYWHVKMKNAVIEEMFNEDINNIIIAYFEEPNINFRKEEIFMLKD